VGQLIKLQKKYSCENLFAQDLCQFTHIEIKDDNEKLLDIIQLIKIIKKEKGLD
jgi:hypothetical protein